jgi:hypothetical protein
MDGAPVPQTQLTYYYQNLTHLHAMPITGPSSYLPTIDAFIAHWTAVNAVRTGLSKPALILEGNRTLAGLGALRAQLALDRTEVEVKANDAEIGRALMVLKQTSLLGRLAQLADHVRTYWTAQGLDRALPNIPGPSAHWTHVEKALDDGADLWTRINGTAVPPTGVTLPLTLLTEVTPAAPSPADLTRAAFGTEITVLKDLNKEQEPAKVRLSNVRGTRNKRQDNIRPWLVDYRAAVEGALPPGHELNNTIPRYSPLPGATPDAAEATGAWNGTTNLAGLDFTPSTSASVVRYELRYVAGPDYDADEENIVASVDVGQPSHFDTLAGLGTPGVTASYRIYAITADGNERASNTVVITRPA